jgi:diguanylate cyclase (GGDEF)-like protein/PAS domain S-box-containing protein
MNINVVTPSPISAPILRSTLPFSFGHEFEPDFRAIVECADDAVIVTDTDLDAPGPTIRFVNPAFTRLTGYTAEDVVGGSPRMLQGPESDHEVLRRITAALRKGEIGQGKVINYGRDGRPYWIDLKIAPILGPDGRPRQFVAFQRDCTEDQQRFIAMRDLALRDALTGVASRRALLDEVSRHLAATHTGEVAFAFLDIDHFKRINDTHGHAVGDAVLMGLADVLGANTRRADAIGRLGGEEFGICMPKIRLSEARTLASRLRASVAAQPFATQVGLVAATCSIGLTMAKPGDRTEDLLARADQALYRAKHEGRNRVCLA